MSFPAKVLLFGEHTVLRGGRGLAIPLPKFSLHWAKGEVDERLLSFARYLKESFSSDQLLTTRLERELVGGARLDGDIPVGYGLGSSGAVCAAVWDRYGLASGKELSTRDLRHVLSRMERHFHGNSSGTDPLVSLLKQPLLLAGGDAGAITLPPTDTVAFFLLDTGHTRQSGKLIERFLLAHDENSSGGSTIGNSSGDGSYVRPANISELIRTEWMPAVEAAIDATIAGDAATLYASFTAVSTFQLAHFPDFIPQAFHEKWSGGDDYRLKLCGAGGGGMLIGLAKDKRNTEQLLGNSVLWL